MGKVTMSRDEWQAQAAKKVAAAQEVLEREVSMLRSGEDWQRYLTFSARLHAYSPNNIMLIAAQHAQAFAEQRVPTPEPTFVAGYRTWQALGRQVDKGQRGYAVLAPVRRRERLAVDPDGSARRLGRGERAAPGEIEQARQVLGGFRVEHVFAAEQTSGAPLPDPPQPKLLGGEAPPKLGESIMGLLELKGYTVSTAASAAELNGANGVTNWGSRSVRVRSDMDDAAMVKTLIHEAAHVLLHESPPGSLMPRPHKEVEAESVAFVVAAAHGMRSDGYSFAYLAGWTGSDPARVIARTQLRVSEAARVLLEVSPAVHLTGGKVPGADQAVDRARRQREEAAAAIQATMAATQAVGVGV